MDRTIQIDTFTRFTRVSRETIISLKHYEEYLVSANKNLNLIGNSTISEIWNRHFLDSAQVIDFIDKNDKTLVDIGSGAGFPGLVLAILSKGILKGQGQDAIQLMGPLSWISVIGIFFTLALYTRDKFLILLVMLSIFYLAIFTQN